MVKIFTTNKNGKIELTEKELKTLLDEVYWEGYRDNSSTWTYSTPISKTYPYWYSTSTPVTNLTSKDITINTSKDNVLNGTTSALNGTITFDTSKMANSVYVGKD